MHSEDDWYYGVIDGASSPLSPYTISVRRETVFDKIHPSEINQPICLSVLVEKEQIYGTKVCVTSTSLTLQTHQRMKLGLRINFK